MITGMMARRNVAPVATDPFFSFVTFLLHMDGDDSSQSWPDVISTTTWQRNAGALLPGPYVDTDKKMFGTASTGFDAPDYGSNMGEFIEPSSMIDGHFMAEEDFVIEGFFSPRRPHFSVGFWWSAGTQNSSTGLQLGVTPTTVWWRSNVFTDLSSSVSISSSEFTHVAWVREGAARRIYVGGNLVASDSNGVFNNAASTVPRLGAVSSDPRYGYRGWIDEVRGTKGSIRGYTGSTITVPTGAFQNS